MGYGTLSLLQLPQNIRVRIWSYAYRDLVVHAQPTNPDQMPNTSGYYAFEYFLCQDTEDPLASPKMTQCYPGVCGSTDNKQTPFLWPIVSKQFWTEATERFYASATFKVGSSIDLYILASSQQQSVKRMRNLIVKLGFGIKHHNRIWSPNRCVTTIKKFESLRGLTLLLGSAVNDDANYTGTCFSCTYDNGEGSPATSSNVTRGSRMQGEVWQESRNWFPVFLRSFQQHRLQEDLTHVKLFERRKEKKQRDNGGGYFYHEKDPRRAQEFERRNDEAKQEALKHDLAASMRAVLLGQHISHLFPDWEAEDRQLIEEIHLGKPEAGG